MSQRIGWKCDGCPKVAETENAYSLPREWLQHCSQAEPGKMLHACGAECMVRVLRGDAAALEEAESRRRAAAAQHARVAEAARVEGLKRAEGAAAKHDEEVRLRQEELSRPGTGR